MKVMIRGLLSYVIVGDCGAGYLRVVPSAPCGMYLSSYLSDLIWLLNLI